MDQNPLNNQQAQRQMYKRQYLSRTNPLWVKIERLVRLHTSVERRRSIISTEHIQMDDHNMAFPIGLISQAIQAYEMWLDYYRNTYPEVEIAEDPANLSRQPVE